MARTRTHEHALRLVGWTSRGPARPIVQAHCQHPKCEWAGTPTAHHHVAHAEGRAHLDDTEAT